MTVEELVAQTAKRYGVDPSLAVEVARAESRFNQALTSAKGAIGVMQLMPATARSLGVDPYNLEQNIDGGVRYLKAQLSRFGDVAAALAAYNWGPENVAAALRAGADWLARTPAETQAYVRGILSRLGQWAKQPGLPSLPEIIPNLPEMSQQVNAFRAMPSSQQGLLLLAAGVVLTYMLIEELSD